MKIGLTYDLRSDYLAAGYSEEETAEFDRDDTITALEKALTKLGHHTDRIGHARHLVLRLAAGDRWDLVFNIAEGMHGIGREAQVPAILDVYDLPYTFSDPLVMALTLHKGMTKHVLRDAGVPTTDFAVVAGPDDVRAIAFDPPYFIKPVAEGTGKGVTPASIVRRREELGAACRNLKVTFHQPVLVERFLPGREFTVGLIGTDAESRALGTMEVHLRDSAEPGVYSYINKEQCEERVEYRLVASEEDPVVAEAEEVALRAWRILGCRDGGRVDVRCDADGRPQFMEVNPLAGLHPEHSDLPILCTHLGISFVQLIEQIVASAALRVRVAKLPRKQMADANRSGA
ncbi:MAG: D-alanine--D-alanine ligase [Desulfatitalea sp.]|nr:D-alanine--D-alanine ligase [Desulfatitalea sp.]